MSSSESSYQSDDSDINFIPGYVVIKDAGINNDGNIQHDDSEHSYAGSYAEEPLADKAWLENYNQEEQEWVEEEKLTRRLNGEWKYFAMSVWLYFNHSIICHVFNLFWITFIGVNVVTVE